MIPIAGVLLLILLVFSVAVVTGNPQVMGMSVFGAEVPVTLGGVYFTGAGAMLVLILAAGLLRAGLRRRRAQRAQLRALKEAAGGGPASTLPTRAKDQAGPEWTRPAEPAPPAAGSSQLGAMTAPAAVIPPVPAGRPGAPAGPAAAAPAAPPAAGPSEGASSTTEAERRALLEEAEELTGEPDDR